MGKGLIPTVITVVHVVTGYSMSYRKNKKEMRTLGKQREEGNVLCSANGPGARPASVSLEECTSTTSNKTFMYVYA
jgi:hypothetical protein